MELIGNRRSERLEKEYKALGYFVLTHPYNNTGIDMVIVCTRSGKIIEVLELTNYARKEEYIKTVKFTRYLNTLNEFNFANIQKTIVVSYWENLSETQIIALQENNIHIRVMGSQD